MMDARVQQELQELAEDSANGMGGLVSLTAGSKLTEWLGAGWRSMTPAELSIGALFVLEAEGTPYAEAA